MGLAIAPANRYAPFAEGRLASGSKGRKEAGGPAGRPAVHARWTPLARAHRLVSTLYSAHRLVSTLYSAHRLVMGRRASLGGASTTGCRVLQACTRNQVGARLCCMCACPPEQRCVCVPGRACARWRRAPPRAPGTAHPPATQQQPHPHPHPNTPSPLPALQAHRFPRGLRAWRGPEPGGGPCLILNPIHRIPRPLVALVRYIRPTASQGSGAY
jgi:hypothetical protein